METIIEILIDKSGSMGDSEKHLIEGVSRMSIVKRILISEIIPTIDYATKIFIRTFHNDTKDLANRSKDKFIIPVIYEGQYDKEKIINAINNISNPGGGTPITAAINVAVSDLIAFPKSDRKIILLTDGEENGGGDYKSAAKKALKLEGIPCKIFIVGLNLDEKEEKEAKEIATGGYINIRTKSFSTEEIKSILIPFKTAVLENTIQNVQQPQKSIESQDIYKTNLEKATEKIESINQEAQISVIQRLNDLSLSIQEQISNNQKVLLEITSLRESLTLIQLGQQGISSTTLTIDNEYSDELRRKSEQFVYSKLAEKYGNECVIWLNQDGESGGNHDFEVQDEQGETFLIIDCKGTPGEKMTFYLTNFEWHYFLANVDKYQIYRVFNVENEMNFTCIENLNKSIMNGDVVPYLTAPEVLKENRVFLTIRKSS
jgi:hypothetical protein